MLVRDETISHGGREYRIMADAGENYVLVESFSAGKKLAKYHVTYETAFEYARKGEGNAIDALMHVAKSDILLGNLSEVKKALSE